MLASALKLFVKVKFRTVFSIADFNDGLEARKDLANI